MIYMLDIQQFLKAAYEVKFMATQFEFKVSLVRTKWYDGIAI